MIRSDAALSPLSQLQQGCRSFYSLFVAMMTPVDEAGSISESPLFCCFTGDDCVHFNCIHPSTTARRLIQILNSSEPAPYIACPPILSRLKAHFRDAMSSRRQISASLIQDLFPKIAG